MSTAAVTHNLQTGAFVIADDLDVNFNDLVTFLNANVVHKDASIAMTGILTLPGSDPTTANQAARKAYVDAADAVNAASLANRIHKDGSVQMTGQLNLQAGTNPTNSDHAARKAYVDAQDTATLASATTLVNTEASTRATADQARMTAPAIATNPKMVGSSSVGVTNGSGKFSIATGLAVSLISATVSNGDSGAGAGLGTAILVEVDWAATTASSLGIQCIRNDNSAAVQAGISVRVTWIALGT